MLEDRHGIEDDRQARETKVLTNLLGSRMRDSGLGGKQGKVQIETQLAWIEDMKEKPGPPRGELGKWFAGVGKPIVRIDRGAGNRKKPRSLDASGQIDCEGPARGIPTIVIASTCGGNIAKKCMMPSKRGQREATSRSRPDAEASRVVKGRKLAHERYAVPARRHRIHRWTAG